ncbi:MAG: hypothetical protein O2798_07530 [Chloroflexi bacterium]|nr:hypothetical protein [Chloroflexota bacterium]MDA1240679.1 hypothetical protein [Chloroflexota bacterium]
MAQDFDSSTDSTKHLPARRESTFEWRVGEPSALGIEDYRELEALVSAEGLEQKWSLKGQREIGSAKVTTDTLTDLIPLRDEVPLAPSIDLHAFSASQPPSYQSAVNLFLETGSMGRIAVFANGSENQQTFDRLIRGISRIITKDPPPQTWVQKNLILWYGISGGLEVLSHVLFLCIVALVVGLLLVHGEDAVSPRWLIAGLVVATTAWILVRFARQRGEVLQGWRPPPFDMWNTAKGADSAVPPRFMARDTTLAIAGIVASGVVAILLTVLTS